MAEFYHGRRAVPVVRLASSISTQLPPGGIQQKSELSGGFFVQNSFEFRADLRNVPRGSVDLHDDAIDARAPFPRRGLACLDQPLLDHFHVRQARIRGNEPRGDRVIAGC
jgi:hypothetical protein